MKFCVQRKKLYISISRRNYEYLLVSFSFHKSLWCPSNDFIRRAVCMRCLWILHAHFGWGFSVGS